MHIDEDLEKYGRIRFLEAGTSREVASRPRRRFPNGEQGMEKKLVLSATATGEEVTEVLASGLVDDVEQLVFGVAKPPKGTEIVELSTDLSSLVHVRTAVVWFPPVPECLFSLPGLEELEIASMTPSFSRVGRPYPSLKKLTVRGFRARKLLKALPEDIACLSGLEELHATGVGLKSLPEGLSEVPLRVLKIHEARGLKKIPGAFGPELEVLQLSNTGIKLAPDTSAAPRARVLICQAG
jgi:hypothetical protein